MSDFTEDINEFIQTASEYKTRAGGGAVASRPSLFSDDFHEQKEIIPDRPTQYSKYGPGYTAVSDTIKTLPSGCYDIKGDDKCVFAVPALAPSGLLLELPEMRSEDVIKIVETFWSSEKDYKEGNEFIIGGAAYRAGVMLWGPAGSGKSSVLKLVSKKLVERGGTVFFASGHPMQVSSFLEDFNKVEPNRKCIVVLEDIDSLIENFGETHYLEMLDSAKTINNVLFIATTNYPDRLDARIYNRPGRFSHIMKIGLPTKKAREAYLKAILKDHRDVEVIVNESEGFTIDHITSLCNALYREKKDLTGELKRLRALFKVPNPNEGRDSISLGRRQEEDV